MSGQGTGSGVDFQARAMALVACHIIAQRPLKWTADSGVDVPIAVTAETGGLGDDIKVELRDSDTIYEAQAKRGLRADAKLDEVIRSFGNGLSSRENEIAILLVDERTSRTVADELREDLNKQRRGQGPPVDGVFERVQKVLRAGGWGDVIDRIHVVVVSAAEPFSPDLKFAQVLLASVIPDTANADLAWHVILTAAVKAIKDAAKFDRTHLISLLESEGIDLRVPTGDAQLLRQIGSDVAELKSIATGLTAPAGLEATPLRAQLEAAKRLVGARKASAALQVLASFEKELEGATPDVREFASNLRSISLLMLDRLQEARAELKITLALNPKNPTALANQAYTALFLGEREEALLSAEKLLSVDARSEAAWIVLVQLAPDRQLPADAAKLAGVRTAKALPLMRAGKWDAALQVLPNADEAGLDAEQLLLIAQCVYGAEFEKAQYDAQQLLVAERLIERILVLVADQDVGSLRERCYITLGQIKQLSADVAASTAAFSSALAHSPASERALYLFAISLAANGEAQQAVFQLQQAALTASSAPLQVALARAFLELGRREEAKGAIRRAVTLPPAQFGESPFELILADVAIDAGEYDLANDLIGKLTAEHEWAAQLFRARIAVSTRDIGQARASFERAISSAPARTALGLAHEYADFLRAEGSLQAAIEVVEQFDIPNNPLLEQLYARLLYEGDEIAKASALIDRILKQGDTAPAWAHKLGAHVAQATENVGRLILHLSALHDRDPLDATVCLQLAHARIRNGEASRATPLLDQLLAGPDLGARLSLMLAEMLVRTSRPHEAVSVALRAYLKDREADDVKFAFTQAMLRYGNRHPDAVAPETSRPDTAVVIKFDNGETVEYLISTTAPRGDLELRSDSPEAARFLGLSVGDTITFREGARTQRTAKVVELKSLLVHHFQHVLRTFALRHPDDTRLQSFSVPEKPEAKDFEFINESVQEQSKSIEELLQQYRQHGGLPLGLLATKTGTTILDVYDLLSGSRGAPLLSEFVDGQPAAIAAAQSAKKVVLTYSVVLTLSKLEAFDTLESDDKVYLTPQSLADEMASVRLQLLEWCDRGDKRVLAHSDGFAVRETPPEAFLPLLAEHDRATAWLRTHSEVRGRPVEGLTAEHSDLREVIGASSYDALELARAEGAELLADDIGLRRLHRAFTGRMGYSTFIAGIVRCGEAALDDRAYRLFAGLVRLRHEVVPLTVETFVYALKHEEYRVDGRMDPLFDRLRDSDVQLVPVAGFVAQLLASLAADSESRPHLGTVAYALIEAAGRGRNAGDLLPMLAEAARVRLQLLPMELDVVLATIDRYHRFAVKMEPRLFYHL